MKLKIVVIGLGSMGRRRVRLLKENFSEIEIYGIDLSKERRIQAFKEFKIETFLTLEEILENHYLNGVIICTAPLSHSKIILKCLDLNLNVFTEINLVSDEYEEIIQKVKEKEIELFLSSTMIYRKELEYIGNLIKESNKKINYRYHVGQYLPDWHPWENYKNFFVGEKRTNGCREILGIELPWILKNFGRISKIHVTKDKISALDLDYPDVFNIILEHETGHKGSLTIDIVSRKAVRNLEVFSENLHIFWEGTPNTLQKYNFESKELDKINTYENIIKNSNYASNIIENVYLEELEIYIKKITKKGNFEKYTFEDDLYTIKIIDEIEGI